MLAFLIKLECSCVALLTDMVDLGTQHCRQINSAVVRYFLVNQIVNDAHSSPEESVGKSAGLIGFALIVESIEKSWNLPVQRESAHRKRSHI